MNTFEHSPFVTVVGIEGIQRQGEALESFVLTHFGIQNLPRAPQNSHMLEWIEACKGKPKTFSPFEIGGPITEIGAAGLIALRSGQNIEWNGAAMKATGVTEATAWVKPQHQEKWGL